MALPYFSIYPEKFFADDRIAELTTEQMGIWILLLMRMWMRDMELKSDDDRITRLLRIEKEKWLELKAKLFETELLYERDGFLMNKEHLSLYQETEKRCEKNRRASLSRWDKAREKETLQIQRDDDWPFGD